MTVTSPISPSMPRWKTLLAESITTAEQLAEHVDVDPDRLAPVLQQFPMRINPLQSS